MGAKARGAGPVERRKSRILAMQALCQLDSQGEAFLDRVPGWLADAGEAQATVTYAQQLVERAWGDRDTTAAELARQATNWTVGRMASVDRNVIRVALAELDLQAAPAKVILDEAVEIANAFGGADSSRFVNGLLDAVWKAAQRGE